MEEKTEAGQMLCSQNKQRLTIPIASRRDKRNLLERISDNLFSLARRKGTRDTVTEEMAGERRRVDSWRISPNMAIQRDSE